MWKPNTFEELTTDHFLLPAMHYPRIRHVFIGVGNKVMRPAPRQWDKWFMQNQMTYDVMITSSAATAFNLLNGEGDNVCCAILNDPTQYERDPEESLMWIPKERQRMINTLKAGIHNRPIYVDPTL